MTKKSSARFNDEFELFAHVEELLRKNPLIVEKVKLLKESYEELVLSMSQTLDSAARSQDFKMELKGLKAHSRRSAAHKAFILMNALKVTGRRNHIRELADFHLYTKKQLLKMSYQNLSDYCLKLCRFAARNKLFLKTLITDDQQLKGLIAALRGYRKKLKLAEFYESEIKRFNELYYKHFEQAEAALDDICEIVDSLMDKQPEFYSRFMQIKGVSIFSMRHCRTEKNKEKRIKDEEN